MKSSRVLVVYFITVLLLLVGSWYMYSIEITTGGKIYILLFTILVTGILSYFLFDYNKIKLRQQATCEPRVNENSHSYCVCSTCEGTRHSPAFRKLREDWFNPDPTVCIPLNLTEDDIKVLIQAGGLSEFTHYTDHRNTRTPLLKMRIPTPGEVASSLGMTEISEFHRSVILKRLEKSGEVWICEACHGSGKA